MFDEFVERINQIVYISATPGPYEMSVQTNMAEQIIRPTGLLDPSVEVRPIRGQMDDLLGEIRARVKDNERVMITTLTKKMAEDLTDFLKEMDVKVRYLHSDIATIERAEIIRDLRAGVFDVLVGINLLREGLDMPEVSLVAILDADKEGFLRSDTSLIQTIGRAARNAKGHVILYADHVTDSMARAMEETKRRREIQEAYNTEHHITPKTIIKEVKDLISLTKVAETDWRKEYDADMSEATDESLHARIVETEKAMRQAAKDLEFEKAAQWRDELGRLRQEWDFPAAASPLSRLTPFTRKDSAVMWSLYPRTRGSFSGRWISRMSIISRVSRRPFRSIKKRPAATRVQRSAP